MGFLALLAYERFRPRRPLDQQLASHFTTVSGFDPRDSGAHVQGIVSLADFQGDRMICLTFTATADQFKLLQESLTRSHPGQKFETIPDEMIWSLADPQHANIDRIVIPRGTLRINTEGPGEVMRQFAFHAQTRQVYYMQESW